MASIVRIAKGHSMQSIRRIRTGCFLGLVGPVTLGCIALGLWAASAAGQPAARSPIGAAQPGALQRTAFGYFPTRWRQWPCDARVDQHFPSSVGREYMPRPAGEPLRPEMYRQELPVPEGLRQPSIQGPGTRPGTALSPTERPGGLLPGALPGGPGAAGPGGGLELPAEPQLPDTGRPPESLLPVIPGGPLPGEPGPGGAVLPEDLLPSQPVPGGTGTEPRPEAPRVEPLLPDVPLAPDRGASSLLRRPVGSKSPSEPPTADADRTAIHQPPLETRPLRRGPIYRPPVDGATGQTEQQARTAVREPRAGDAEPGAIRADWNALIQTGERPYHGGLSGRYGGGLSAWHRAEPIPSHQPAEQSRAEQAHAPAEGQPAGSVRMAGFDAPLPTALDGFCPVELVKNERWVRGDPRWAVDYQGRRYLMSSEVQRESFLVNPQRYVPAYEGHDPVLLLDQGQRTPGLTRYCATYDGRLYMFSNPATLARFRQQPKRYALEP